VQRPSLETNFKFIADFEDDRLAVDIGRQRWISLTTARITAAGSRKCKIVVKLAVPGIVKCFETMHF
jgi:hypothetical protein